MIPLGPVVARSKVSAARDAAWSYLVDPERRAEWWPELEFDPRVGGAIAERWTDESGDATVSRDASGTIDVWVEGHAIGFTWREDGDARDTAVLLTLRSQVGSTGITVTETGFDALPMPAERAAASQDGWMVLLRDLVAAIEAGVASGVVAVEPEQSVAGHGGAGSPEAAPERETVGGALEVVPTVATGEIDEWGESLDVRDAESDDALEIEPEPELGAHLELDTVSVKVIADGAETGDTRDASGDGLQAEPEAERETGVEAESQTGVEIDPEGEVVESVVEVPEAEFEVVDPEVVDPEVTDLEVPEPQAEGAGAQADPEPEESGEREPESSADRGARGKSASSTGDPDFDDLIRGLI